MARTCEYLYVIIWQNDFLGFGLSSNKVGFKFDSYHGDYYITISQVIFCFSFYSYFLVIKQAHKVTY